MLIEAAKGGHTGVVSVLIDYNPNNLDPSGASGGVVPPGVAGPASTDTSAIEVSGEVVQCDTVAAVTAVTNTNSPSGGPVPEDSLIPLTRFPAEGHEGHEGQQGQQGQVPLPTTGTTTTSTSAQTAAAPSNSASTSLPNKSK